MISFVNNATQETVAMMINATQLLTSNNVKFVEEDADAISSTI